MSCSEDSYDYDSYYDVEELERPPLIKTRSRLIAAVLQNQVDILKDLLDSPKWYNVTDKGGYSLLQIAILGDNKEVFDYMMSIPDFPLEFTNKKGETAFVVSLCGFVCDSDIVSEHFAHELLKRGVCIDKVCEGGNTPLHCALERAYMTVATLLIEAGVDVNVVNDEGFSPLDLALSFKDEIEPVTALLVYGAKPSLEHFRSTVKRGDSFLLQESLFLYLFDKYSEVEMDVILKLASTQSPLFHEIIKFPIKVNVRYKYVYSYFRDLCSMPVDSLKILIDNLEPYIREVFPRYGCPDFYTRDRHKVIAVENLNVMLESDLRFDVLRFINASDSCEFFNVLIDEGCGESIIEELYCFLLSYGLNIDEMDLQLVYQKFGYCKLFKTLLHMDFKMGVKAEYEKRLMPIFIYDVRMDLDTFLKDTYGYTRLELRRLYYYEHANVKGIDELFSYFAQPLLREVHDELSRYPFDDEIVSTREHLPQVPLLVELSRNVFRTFFIKKFQITTSRKFFTLLNRLPISTTHKKIISYETKLY